MDDQTKSSIITKVYTTFPSYKSSSSAYVTTNDVRENSINGEIIDFLIAKEDDPQFYQTRKNILLNDFKTCIATFSKEAQESHSSRMKQWGRSSIVPVMDIKEKLISPNRFTKKITIQNPTCKKCAQKGKIILGYNMLGINDEKITLFQTKIQLIPYKTMYFPASGSSYTNMLYPAKIESDIPLTETEKKEYVITLDENGEKEIDWSEEKFAKYSDYHVVVLPVEPSEVDKWLSAYQNIIDGLQQKLEENWEQFILPEWEIFINLDIYGQHRLLSDGWNKGQAIASNEKMDEFKEAWQKFEEWDFRGWLDELFKGRVVCDEPMVTLLQDEVIFYIAAHYAQCWIALLPPHQKIIFTGKMYGALMISMMETIVEFIVESLVLGGIFKIVSLSVSMGLRAAEFVASMDGMLNGFKTVMKSYKANSSLLSHTLKKMKIEHSSNIKKMLTARLQPLIKIEEKLLAKLTSRLPKTKSGKTTPLKPAESADPISMVTGEERLILEDGELKGLLPFIWQRCYRSSAVEHNIGLGYGWSHALSQHLYFKNDEIVWLDNENLFTTFPFPTIKTPMSLNPLAESALFLSDNEDEFLVSKSQGAGFYHFIRKDDIGILTAISDKYGHRLNVIYDDKQRIIALQGQEDKLRRLAFSYADDLSVLIESVSVQRLAEKEWQTQQTLVQYHYNERQQLTGATNAAGQCESYQYDECNVIQKRIMAGGAEFNWLWQGEGKEVRCLRQWGNFGQLDEIYHWKDEDVTVTMADGSEKSYAHKGGLLLSETDAAGATKTYQYNEDGLKTVETDAAGNETRYRYTVNGELAEISYPDGRCEEFTWQRGRIIRAEKNGLIWRLRYNENNDITEEETPDGLLTRHSYNQHGQRLTSHFPDGTALSFKWGESGELLEERYSDGKIRRFGYDALLRVIQVSDEHQATTYYRYDALGQITCITYPDKTTREYQYNAYGKVTKFKDETGKITEYEYAAPLHLMTEKRLPNGEKLKFRYDNIHLQVSEIENQKGEVYHLRYTPTGQLSEEIGFDGIKTTYHYDVNGHLTEKHEYGDNYHAEPLITRYRRNLTGQLMVRELPDGKKEHYRYNDNGLLTAIDDGQSVLAWEYDEVGRLTAEHQNWATIRHRYDPQTGVLNGTKLPDGQWLEYHHRHGQLRGITLDGESITGILYDGAGRECERRQGNGLINRYRYNELGQLASHQVYRGFDITLNESPAPVWQQQYQYEADGQLAEIRGNQPRRYRYDKAGQLQTVSYPDSQREQHHAEKTELFNYDPTGNKINEKQPLSAQAFAANIAKGNRLIFFSDKHFEYDRFGNLITEKRGKNQSIVTHYEYDCRHRLIKVIKPTGMIITYTYDPFNRRTSKTVNGKTTEFIWQGNKLIAETDNDTHWQSYIYEPDSFRPLALIKGNAQQDNIQRYWYQNDQLGTPIRLTDSIGETLYQCEYNAYGQVIDENYYCDHIDTLPDNPLRFQGQYYDEETGLHYNLNRYYDPFVGRYITQDPIGILSDLNFYRYVGNNTIRGIDPTGLDYIVLYRGTSLGIEKFIYQETGGVLSQTGALVYYAARREGLSIRDAWSKAIIESKYLHAKAIKEWGSLDQYIQAHGEWGQEVFDLLQGRSLISFTSDAEIAKEFATYANPDGIVIRLKVLKSSAKKQTLKNSKEKEYLIINGIK